MKKFIAILIALLSATLFAFGAVACGSSESQTDSTPNESISASVPGGETSSESDGGESSSSSEPEHTHDFCIENTDAKYLKSSATCKQKAIYYYACSCGEKGKAMFEYGEVAEHTYSEEWSYDETYH